jgi:hypothetical protein
MNKIKSWLFGLPYTWKLTVIGGALMAVGYLLLDYRLGPFIFYAGAALTFLATYLDRFNGGKPPE